MESLEDILKRLGPTISSAGTANSSANAAIADAEYHCEICDDARWLSVDAPVGTPEFGRVIPCHCQGPAWGTNPSNRLRLYSGLGALQRLTFDSLNHWGRPEYVESSSFRRAQAAAMRFAERPAGWLVFAGPTGTGKTHLAAAIANFTISRGRAARFVAVPELLGPSEDCVRPCRQSALRRSVQTDCRRPTVSTGRPRWPFPFTLGRGQVGPRYLFKDTTDESRPWSRVR